LCSDEKLLDRFLREAQLSASVESPYIVRVLDAGMVVQGPFIAMELLQGEDLATHFQVEGLLSLSELLALATQVGAGLDAAAGAKIVHRDIKPQNLFLVDTDAHPGDSQVHKHGALHCKILDFGVARVMSGQAELTQGDTILGTPSYMSPEQATGKVTDHRTDLHALAAVLYRGCTGFLPFTGENSQAVLYAVVHSMPPDPSELAGLPESLDSFFAKAFAKNPDDRYQSGLELSNALGRACASFS
jgi:serine/threonine-protein kinase